MTDRNERGIAVVVTVSDSVVAGERVDRSGPAAMELLSAHFDVAPVRSCSDGISSVVETLLNILGTAPAPAVIVTTGGTGFGPRDLTPEGTRRVIDREAPGLAEAMRGANPALGRLSRGVAGIAGTTIVLNLPGSTAGVEESLGAVLDVLVHASRLATSRASVHPSAPESA